MTNYMNLCPRFERCSVNACPLDSVMSITHSKDPRKKCKAHLRDRLAVVERAKSEGVFLPAGGLTAAERKRLGAGETVEALLAEWDAWRKNLRTRLAGGSGGRPEASRSHRDTLPASLATDYKRVEARLATPQAAQDSPEIGKARE